MTGNQIIQSCNIEVISRIENKHIKHEKQIWDAHINEEFGNINFHICSVWEKEWKMTFEWLESRRDKPRLMPIH